MNKTSPFARAVREFMFLMAASGVFAALAKVDWLKDWRLGAVALLVAVLGCGIAAVGTYFLALSEWWQAHVQSALARAFASALKQLGAGFVAVQIVSLDKNVLVDTGHALLNLVGSSVVAFVFVYMTNSAEGTPVVVPPPAV